MLYLAHQKDIRINSVDSLLAANNISQWIYLGDDTNWRIRAESVIPESITRLSIAQKLKRASDLLRQPYIDWIGDLSQKNHSLLWWASELSAKNPYLMLFTRICLLYVAHDIMPKGFDRDTLIICSSPAIFREVGICADQHAVPWRPFPDNPGFSRFEDIRGKGKILARHAAGMLPPLEFLGKVSPEYQLYLDKNLIYRRNILKKHGIEEPEPFSGDKTVVFFSWIDSRNFSADGSYTDPNFGPLPRAFNIRGYNVAFVPRILHTMRFEEAVIRLKKTKERLYFPEQFTHHSDVRICQNKSRVFAPRIPMDSSIATIPVFSLAMEHIEQTRSLIADNLLYDVLIRNMRQAGIVPARIIHTCEGHSWETSLTCAVHRHMPLTKVIGYDNVTFSRFVLSMYPSKTELDIKPLPDYIVTNGPLFKETLLREGYPGGRVRSGCALRHTYLWKDELKTADLFSGTIEPPVKILIATAIGLGDSVELIAKAARAFGGNEKYQLLIKCHPLVNIGDVKMHLGHLLDHANIRFTSATIGELLLKSHILLYTYTSVCYEALLHGVYPVCVAPENFIDLDKLDATPEIRRQAITPEELLVAAESIIKMAPAERKAWIANANQVVRLALAPMDDHCIDAFLSG